MGVLPPAGHFSPVAHFLIIEKRSITETQEYRRWPGRRRIASARKVSCMACRKTTSRVGLLSWLLALFVLCTVGHAQEARVLYDFEESEQGWRLLRQDGELSGVNARNTRASAGARGLSLAIDTDLPERCGAGTKLPRGKRNWNAFTHLTFRVYCPYDAPEKLQLFTYVKDTELNYYEHRRPGYMSRGQWTEVSIDLTAQSEAWEFKDHYKPWDGYCRQDVQELGVRFAAPQSYEGILYVEDIKLERRESALPTQNALYNLRVNSETVPMYGKFEISFNLAKTYSNPFDPDVVKVTGVFIAPDGKVMRVPGFFYQGYLRRMEKRAESLTPMGRSQWKIRFAPRQLGVYHYCVEIEDGDELRSEMGRFRCVESSGSGGTSSDGFVQISKRDKYCFDLSNGDYFYPIGHNIATVHDPRASNLAVSIPASEGTYAYDRFLRKMGEHGENMGRIWMTPGGFEIEWTKGRDIHFRGLGRYNLCNAWRLDHIIETARRHGVYLIVVITGPDEVGTFDSNVPQSSDERLRGSPYWERNGGPLADASEFYTADEALELYKRQLRYIAARWGYSTSIMAWEILNKPDQADYYRNSRRYARLGAEFVRKAADYLREEDPGNHLITSNLAQYKSPIAALLLSLEEVDFTTGHVFAGELEEKLLSDVQFMQEKFGKIFLATAAGVTQFPQSPEPTVRTIHRTLWASHMMPYAGVAMPWWWGLIDRWNLYPQFQALRKFAEGQDRRGKDYRPAEAEVSSLSEDRQLAILALRSSDRAYAWVYNRARLSAAAAWKESNPAGAEVSLSGLGAGTYSVEVWDTYKGEMMEKMQVETESGPVEFELPAFEKDVAVKVKKQTPAS